jgi:hypothetical protein
MGRGPTHRPGRWGVRCPEHADQVGVQQLPALCRSTHASTARAGQASVRSPLCPTLRPQPSHGDATPEHGAHGPASRGEAQWAEPDAQASGLKKKFSATYHQKLACAAGWAGPRASGWAARCVSRAEGHWRWVAEGQACIDVSLYL